MSGLMRTRLGLGAVGVVVGLYGVYLLLTRQDFPEIRNVVEWLVAAVVIHDGLIAAATLVVAGALILGLRRWAVRGPVIVGLVVIGAVTVEAIPVLGRFGATPDNPTLLDRHYTIGWLVIVVLVAIGVGLGMVFARRAVEPRGAVSVTTGEPDAANDEGPPTGAR